ncbi:MAG TPA: hypothetical protein VFR67_19525 [Pilimelia sp.]|nr:hypothetical protein [Pilimelia sp.]
MAGQLLDKLTQQLGAKIETDLDEQLRRIEQTLSRIEARQEDQAAAPLREALTYLQLREIGKARDRLIAAEAVEPASSIARILLAAVFAMGGNSRLALSRLRDAWRLNPYVFTMVDRDIFDTADPIASVDRAAADASRRWRVDLGDPNLWEAAPRPRTWGRFFGAVFDMGNDDTEVSAVASFGEKIAVQWTRGHGYFVVDNYLSCVGVEDGRIAWTQRPESSKADTWTLQFATPSVLVIGRRSTPGDGPPARFELLRIKDGASWKVMSASYFATTFGPDPGQLEDLKTYAAGNIGSKTESAKVEDRTRYSLDNIVIAVPFSAEPRWIRAVTRSHYTKFGSPHGGDSSVFHHTAWVEGLR